jgi:hypothetical protein
MKTLRGILRALEANQLQKCHAKVQTSTGKKIYPSHEGAYTDWMKMIVFGELYERKARNDF